MPKAHNNFYLTEKDKVDTTYPAILATQKFEPPCKKNLFSTEVLMPDTSCLQSNPSAFFPLKKRILKTPSPEAAPATEMTQTRTATERRALSPSLSPTKSILKRSHSREPKKNISWSLSILAVEPQAKKQYLGVKRCFHGSSETTTANNNGAELCLNAFKQAIYQMIEKHAAIEKNPVAFSATLLSCFAVFLEHKKSPSILPFKLYFEALQLTPDNWKLQAIIDKLIKSNCYNHVYTKRNACNNASALITEAQNFLAQKPILESKNQQFFEMSFNYFLTQIKSEAGITKQTISSFVTDLANSLDNRSYLKQKAIRFTEFYFSELLALSSSSQTPRP